MAVVSRWGRWNAVHDFAHDVERDEGRRPVRSFGAGLAVMASRQPADPSRVAVPSPCALPWIPRVQRAATTDTSHRDATVRVALGAPVRPSLRMNWTLPRQWPRHLGQRAQDVPAVTPVSTGFPAGPPGEAPVLAKMRGSAVPRVDAERHRGRPTAPWTRSSRVNEQFADTVDVQRWVEDADGALRHEGRGQAGSTAGRATSPTTASGAAHSPIGLHAHGQQVSQAAPSRDRRPCSPVLAASSPARSLVESVALRPCQRRI